MKLFIFLTVIFFSSCSNSQVKKAYVDKELEPYVTEFKNILGDNNSKLYILENTTIRINNIKQEKEKNRTLGECSYMLSSFPEIDIDQYYWNNSTPLSKQFTVYHELGHCVCNLFHTEEIREKSILDWFENILLKLKIVKRKGYLEDGCPASIMHPYEFSEWCMSEHYSFYIEQLQKTCQ